MKRRLGTRSGSAGPSTLADLLRAREKQFRIEGRLRPHLGEPLILMPSEIFKELRRCVEELGEAANGKLYGVANRAWSSCEVLGVDAEFGDYRRSLNLSGSSRLDELGSWIAVAATEHGAGGPAEPLSKSRARLCLVVPTAGADGTHGPESHGFYYRARQRDPFGGPFGFLVVSPAGERPADPAKTEKLAAVRVEASELGMRDVPRREESAEHAGVGRPERPRIVIPADGLAAPVEARSACEVGTAATEAPAVTPVRVDRLRSSVEGWLPFLSECEYGIPPRYVAPPRAISELEPTPDWIAFDIHCLYAILASLRRALARRRRPRERFLVGFFKGRQISDSNAERRAFNCYQWFGKAEVSAWELRQPLRQPREPCERYPLRLWCLYTTPDRMPRDDTLDIFQEVLAEMGKRSEQIGLIVTETRLGASSRERFRIDDEAFEMCAYGARSESPVIRYFPRDQIVFYSRGKPGGIE